MTFTQPLDNSLTPNIDFLQAQKKTTSSPKKTKHIGIGMETFLQGINKPFSADQTWKNDVEKRLNESRVKFRLNQNPPIDKTPQQIFEQKLKRK